HHVAQRIAPELERAILSIRRRLQAHAAPATRYRLVGAPAILAELKALGIRPLPNPRTIERVLQRNGLTAPRARPAPLLPRPAAGPPPPPRPPPGGAGPAGPGLQRTARGRSRRASLPQGPPPPLLHLGRQGRLRRRRLPATGPIPPHGRGAGVPRRELEGPGP